MKTISDKMKRVKLNIKTLIVIIAIPLAIFFYIAFESNDAVDNADLIGGDGVNIIAGDDAADAIVDLANDLGIDALDYADLIGGDGVNIIAGDDDNDGINIIAGDDDNDGIVNAIDAFPLNPEEWDDFDFDGIGANEDEDDDNDGILDINDTSPSHPSTQLSMKYLDLIENCTIMDSGFSRNLCLKDVFVLLVEKGESGFEVMNFATFFDNRDVIDDCHHTAHYIGYVTFQKNQNLTESMINVENTCREGYYHGVMSAFFVNFKKDGKDISSSYKTVCDEFVDNKDVYQPCVHGIGHGLVFYYEDDLRQAVDGCHELPEDLDRECMHGVFMQYTDNELTKSTSFEEDIPEICSKIELTSKDSMLCYSKLGQMLAFRTNHDLYQTFKFCNSIKDQEDVDNCYIGVMGSYLASRELRNECELLGGELVDLDCYNKVFRDILIRVNLLE